MRQAPRFVLQTRGRLEVALARSDANDNATSRCIALQFVEPVRQFEQGTGLRDIVGQYCGGGIAVVCLGQLLKLLLTRSVPYQHFAGNRVHGNSFGKKEGTDRG